MGDASIISSKLLSDEALGICVKVTGLEGLQTDQVSRRHSMIGENVFQENVQIRETETCRSDCGVSMTQKLSMLLQSTSMDPCHDSATGE
jgi:hypothetical protein